MRAARTPSTDTSSWSPSPEGNSKLGRWYQEAFNKAFSVEFPAVDDHSILSRDVRTTQYLAEHLIEPPVLLACRALGLSVTLTTAHRGFESRIHTKFGISDAYGVVAMSPTGYPLAAGRGGEPGECRGNSLAVS